MFSLRKHNHITHDYFSTFFRCFLHGYLYVVPSVTFMGFVTVCLFSYGCMLFTSSAEKMRIMSQGNPAYGCNVNEVCILLQPTCCLLVNSEDASAYYYLFIIICFSGVQHKHTQTHTHSQNCIKGQSTPKEFN